MWRQLEEEEMDAQGMALTRRLTVEKKNNSVFSLLAWYF